MMEMAVAISVVVMVVVMMMVVTCSFVGRQKIAIVKSKPMGVPR